MKNLFLKKIYGYFRRYDWIILFGLIAVHFFLKDRLRLSSLIFYATPLPLIICFSVLCCYNHRHNKKALYGLLTLTLPLCFFWGISSYKLTESSDKIVCLNKSLNVTFWNIARIKKHPSPALINHLRSINSDIIGCVEAGALTDQAVTDYQNLFPEYSVKNLSGGMLCITKGKIKSVIYMRLPHRSRYNLLEIQLDKNIFYVMIVDINSNPFVSRKKLLAAILKKMLRKKRVIIMGDFNTPYNSVFFDEYKSKFFHAFQKAGSGFDATWPYGIPLLHIDHIWISKDMKPLKLRKKYHLISDHAKLDLEIGI